MADCHKCGATLTVGPSFDPRFLLLSCEECEPPIGRPIKLLLKDGRIGTGRQPNKADLNRAMRAHRRTQLKGKHGSAPAEN